MLLFITSILLVQKMTWKLSGILLEWHLAPRGLIRHGIKFMALHELPGRTWVCVTWSLELVRFHLAIAEFISNCPLLFLLAHRM
jgi:hypothetical protein